MQWISCVRVFVLRDESRQEFEVRLLRSGFRLLYGSYRYSINRHPVPTPSPYCFYRKSRLAQFLLRFFTSPITLSFDSSYVVHSSLTPINEKPNFRFKLDLLREKNYFSKIFPNSVNCERESIIIYRKKMFGRHYKRFCILMRIWTFRKSRENCGVLRNEDSEGLLIPNFISRNSPKF